MSNSLEVESTLTDRYQTTVPETVRRALKLGKRDRIHYTIRPDGEVVLSRATAADEADPVLTAFLGFLANDMAVNPQHLQAISPELAQRIESLVGDVDVELDEILPDDDE